MPNHDVLTVSVSEAAAIFKVSEKTVRRRIKAGELTASKQPLDGGGIGWRVNIGTVLDIGTDNAMETEVDARRNRDGQRAGTPHAQAPTAMDNAVDRMDRVMDNRAGTGTDSAMDTRGRGASPSIIPLAISQNADRAQLNHEVELLRVQLDSARAEASREREQSDFLKSQLEDANRNAQELRASLRAALSAMPKQLTAGDAATSPPQDAPQINAPNNVPIVSPDAVKSPPARTPRPLWKLMFGIK